MADRSSALRRRMMLALAAVVAAAAFAVDAAVTAGDVAPVPAPCEAVTDPVCNDERNAEFEVRLDDAFELEDGLEVRYWIYAVAFVLAALGIGAAGPRAEAEPARTVLDDLGILGVAWVPAGVLLMVLIDAGLVGIPAQPLFAPAVALIVVAGAGRLAAPGGGEPRRERSPLGTLVPWVGLGLVVLTVAVTAAVVVSQGSQAKCGTDDEGWVDAFRTLAAVAGGGAAVLGIVSLLGRRWIEALVCITVGPVAAIVALVAGVCFS
jgi:hypothetical protein